MNFSMSDDDYMGMSNLESSQDVSMGFGVSGLTQRPADEDTDPYNFEINLKGVQASGTVDWDKLVSKTEGYSGADIANVCRDAAMMPMRFCCHPQASGWNAMHSKLPYTATGYGRFSFTACAFAALRRSTNCPTVEFWQNLMYS